MEIQIPQRLRLIEVLQTARAIRDLPNEGDAYIDFGQMGIAGPFGLLMLSNAISRKRNESPNLRLHPRNYARHTYFAHMGFFRASGFDYGREPGAAQGNENYIPVTKQGITAIHSESKDTGRPLGELVEEEARSLAEVLCRTRNGDLYNAMTYAIREIIRNTVEHSKSPGVEFCAQYWAAKDKVEIAVIDRGIGLFKSLSTNPTLKIDSEQHAINAAMLPGISRNVRQDRPEPVTSVWQNSGFGLFMTQRMCRFGGDFFLASGAFGKYLQNEKTKWFDFGFSGTAVRLVMRPSSIGNISLALKRFEDEGLRIAKANNIKTPNASTASKMINLDFYNIQ